jgi:hypothetical protein
MELGEQFSAKVVSPSGGGAPPSPPVKPRHYVIGYGVIAAVVGALVWWFAAPGHHQPEPATMHERPGLIESLGTKIGGVITLKQIRAGAVIGEWGPFHNTIVNEGENVLEDCFEGNAGAACTQVALFKFHGLGTSATVIAETDGGCLTELTTQYTGDVRATGSQTNNGANVYRTVATNTIDSGGPVSIEEFCLMDTASGAGNTWTRILTGTITLQTNDGLQTTYDLTIE